jgi:hypothetical protein
VYIGSSFENLADNGTNSAEYNGNVHFLYFLFCKAFPPHNSCSAPHENIFRCTKKPHDRHPIASKLDFLFVCEKKTCYFKIPTFSLVHIILHFLFVLQLVKISSLKSICKTLQLPLIRLLYDWFILPDMTLLSDFRTTPASQWTAKNSRCCLPNRNETHKK